MINSFLYKKSLMQEVIEKISSMRKENRTDWIDYERRSLLEYINIKRVCNNLPPIDMPYYIRYIDNPATGHSDYANKIALYCAETILDERSVKC